MGVLPQKVAVEMTSFGCAMHIKKRLGNEANGLQNAWKAFAPKGVQGSIPCVSAGWCRKEALGV